jgi:hypothetical protein
LGKCYTENVIQYVKYQSGRKKKRLAEWQKHLIASKRMSEALIA